MCTATGLSVDHSMTTRSPCFARNTRVASERSSFRIESWSVNDSAEATLEKNSRPKAINDPGKVLDITLTKILRRELNDVFVLG
jgi:hypothetical protein